MSNIIKVVQNDTGPTIVCTITDQITGNPVGLTGASVVLKIRPVGSTTLQATAPGVVTNGAAGQIAFFPASTPAMFAGTPGSYEGEIVITYANGTVQTVYQTLKFQLKAEF